MDQKDKLGLLPHHPQSLEGDKLDAALYARTICEALAGLTYDQTGLTIGIYGDWGSGKSTVLTMAGQLLDMQSELNSLRGITITRLLTFRHRALPWLWFRSLGRWSKRGRLLRAVRSQSARPRPGPASNQRLKPGRYRPLVIRFEAWKYSKEQVWIALLRTIVETIRAHYGSIRMQGARFQLQWTRIKWGPALAYLLGLAIRFALIFAILAVGVWTSRSLGKSEGWLNDAYTRIVELLGMSTTIPGRGIPGFVYWLKSAKDLPTRSAAILTLITALSQWVFKSIQWIWRVRLTLPNRLFRATVDKETLPTVDLFHRELEDLIRVVGWRRPIVVLIDDLDRAPMDEIVSILEATKHFGIRPDPSLCKDPQRRRAPIAFVFAADRQAIRCAIGGHYKDALDSAPHPGDRERFAREYLEKIVQISFELPPLLPSRLLHLLPATPSPGRVLPGQVRSLASARYRAREVFVRGYQANPRQVIQAYNSFQAVWRVIQHRKLADIDPELLAALILIRYIWPETLARIFSYPELLFDLHALARDEPNGFCDRCELAELSSLGCPQAEQEAMIEEIRQNQVELFSLLQPVELPLSLGPDRLYRYLSLVPDPPENLDRPRTEVGAALLSGDPSRIKYAARNDSRARQERLLWLIEFIEPGKTTPDAEQRMQQALFALGRLEDKRAVEPIKHILEKRHHYSEAVVARAVYALAHLVERDLKEPDLERETAHRVLAELLRDETTSDALRVRILRLLDPEYDLEQRARKRIVPELSGALVHLALHDPSQLVRDRALEFVRRGNWLQELYHELVSIEPEPSREVLDGYLRIVSSCLDQAERLPVPVRAHLVGLAVDTESPHQSQAFHILYTLKDAGESVQALADVVVETKDDAIIQQAIEWMGNRQRTAEGWQTDAWHEVEARLAGEPPALWIHFARALGRTGKREAVPILKRMLDPELQPAAYVRGAAHERLDELAAGRGTPEAAADAQKVLEEWDAEQASGPP